MTERLKVPGRRPPTVEVGDLVGETDTPVSPSRRGETMQRAIEQAVNEGRIRVMEDGNGTVMVYAWVGTDPWTSGWYPLSREPIEPSRSG